MPGFDGTGPTGDGQRAGRGGGRCRANDGRSNGTGGRNNRGSSGGMRQRCRNSRALPQDNGGQNDGKDLKTTSDLRPRRSGRGTR